MIQLALFDMDGTLFESYLNWVEIKKTLNIQSGNILEELLGNGLEDSRRMALLEQFERENTIRTQPIAGVHCWLSHLEALRIKTALVTNNNRDNTFYLLEKFKLKFDLVATRELGLWKPSPTPLLFAMERFNLTPSETISIGDSRYDIMASQAARIPHIFIREDEAHPGAVSADSPSDIAFFNDFHHLKKIFDVRFLQN